MLPPLERVLVAWIGSGARAIGQIRIAEHAGAFALCHREDAGREDLQIYRAPNDAVEIAKFDDSGHYRPLKTAPNLRRGWRLDLADLAALRLALDFFYPGRVAALTAWDSKRLSPTPLRTTLGRQSGMYRIASQISDGEVDRLVGRFCRSQGGEPGCLRTILWRRDENGATPSTELRLEKFQPEVDQTGRGEKSIPLLCQEPCNLLVAEARRVVRGEA